ncbi:MAG: hypothetical protein PF693_14660 [Spirochaetia bacterium]|jgi:hypothetical protein|nr:hypothetical protein [Spirochaetia bacterium]
MRKLPFKNENQKRIGKFLIEMNILSFEQVLSILLSESIPDPLKKSALAEGITLSQLNDLTN